MQGAIALRPPTAPFVPSGNTGSVSSGRRRECMGGRAAAQQQERTRRPRLEVAACHRCVQRQLVCLVRPQPIGRGLSFVAAVKGSAGAEADTAAARQETAAGLEAPLEAGSAGPVGSTAVQQRQQQQQVQQSAGDEEQQQDSAGVRAALAMLKFYKAAISPLLPPACRFLPTCSVYSMEAFQRYGVSKGFVLTAWRLFRCSPWGNSGYDPVKWPPPGLERLFGEGSGSGGSSGSA